MIDLRTDLARTFADKHGWSGIPLKIIAGDASNRKYYRLTRSDESVILMDAPPEKGEDTGPFIRIARFLNDIGLSAPLILHADPDLGLLLIEDFGDALFARLLERGEAQETTLYFSATDVLLHLHAHQPPNLRRYDADTMSDMAALSIIWYRNNALTADDGTIERDFRSAAYALFEPLDSVQPVLIQRDYHAENLLWLPNREGVRRVGLLDFQDAMLGHPAYDLVSILQDARRDVSREVETQMLDKFINASDHSAETFKQSYCLLGLQRNLRILGVFARLCVRDAKPHYVDLIPRVWDHIQHNLSNLNDSGLTSQINDTLPAPTSDILDQLKAKCPTRPQPQ